MGAASIVALMAIAPAEAKNGAEKPLERLLRNVPAELTQVRTGDGGKILSVQARKCALSFKTARGIIEVIFTSEDGASRSASQAIIVDTANGIAGIAVPGDHDGTRYEAEFDELEAALNAYARGCGRT